MENRTIEFYHNESQFMNDAVDRIVVKVHHYKKAYSKKSILLTGCSPACGVTTMSINLAIALSMAGWKTLLVDCDLRKGLKYKRFGEKAMLGLSDYLAKKTVIEKVINKTNYESLDYVSCGSQYTSPVRLLCSADMTSFMDYANKEYEYIIMDFPSINVVSDANILFQNVDGIVLVAGLNQTTKKQLWDAKYSVAAYNEKYYGLIINRVDMKQYGKSIQDYDYFKQQKLEKKHRLSMKKVTRRVKKGMEASHEENE
jgi:capsular exopolysaccharide synthesis family protein